MAEHQAQGRTEGGRVGRNAPPASEIYWCFTVLRPPCFWNLLSWTVKF